MNNIKWNHKHVPAQDYMHAFTEDGLELRMEQDFLAELPDPEGSGIIIYTPRVREDYTSRNGNSTIGSLINVYDVQEDENSTSWVELRNLLALRAAAVDGDEDKFKATIDTWIDGPMLYGIERFPGGDLAMSAVAAGSLDEHIDEVRAHAGVVVGHDKFVTAEELAEEEGLCLFPLYAYIHGGVELSLGKFFCPWDSGQLGWIAANKSEFIVPEGESEHAFYERVLRSFLEEFNAYLSGDVHVVAVYDADGEMLTSIGEIVGEPLQEIIDDLLDEAREML